MDFPAIDPVIFSIGPVALRWYGLMYLLGFLAAWWLGNHRARKPGSGWTGEQVSDFLFYGFLGVVLGGRLGYVFFYQFGLFLDNPLYLFRIWEGGMSFHGGLLGVLVAFIWYAKANKRAVFDVADFFAPLVPPGLFFGRIGNFINAELWGREAGPDVPWAFRFPTDSLHLLRHPSQLYEALLEGLLLFLILWFFSRQSRPRMAVSGLFAAGYGVFRFIVEYFREPDAHLGLQALGLSRGQWLCVPLIATGVVLLVLAYRRGNAAPALAK
ncbi:prolipoprotein diacylglyceryl transferase [Permianibacter sp. IMCC34836]|uniref:prolipoprotein diacylglyceryl transferase n=1 Tax=Permianibacter fluminis TaxID=2738515 RepID=UPI0015554C2D|nr:prolipoprotein diacylglyceryl transferase [Permianibacter fluminis]NQD36325.1 prolipoprotein diacylglyceryl transferase [Permianibacter fluminis]